ncbi:PREDICTED: dynein heavy chain 12, axonemal [Chaetura pelagica]|uniref:dynein heavy chain 12, axonemal n=1 Tax=Chaetura pelagica TaxID=8897 RepID=UPI00052332BD|nr:PREDICTED: dynein heavy chain 12, axonemal [Chaetura pelagica]
MVFICFVQAEPWSRETYLLSQVLWQTKRFKMAHSDGEPSNEKALRTFFSPTVLPSSVTSDTSPLQNKLLAYRRCNEQQKMLNQLLIDRALKAYRISMEEKEHRAPPPPIPELPSTTNYLFMKSRVLSNPMVPIQQQWLMSLLSLVPQSLMEGKNEKLLTEQLLGEIIKDYEISMRRFMVRRVLIKPDIDGLKDEEAPLPSLPLGLDFSTPWRKSFIQAKNQILSNLHIVHPTMRTLLDFGSSAFSDFLLVDFSSFRQQKPINCENLKAYVSSSCSQAEEKILNTWYKNVLSLFSENEALDGVKLDQVDSFFNCVATLMSNQLKELLGRTVEDFVKHFVPEDGNCLPLFKMELTLDENIMEFYPSLPDFEEAILFVVNRVGQTLQDVQTVRSWLMGGTATLDAELPSHVRAWATSTLINCIRDNLEGPKKYFESYVERYGWLVDGTAQARIERFEKEEHSFDEYADFIDEFFTLKKEIMSLPQGADFPMICLSCEDLKQGLANKANTFANMLMDKIVQDYREENEKICREFETMKERALKVPETTEEMMETIAYMEKFKTKGIRDLSSRIKECCRQMNYLLDVCIFSSEDIALNSAVVLWPSRINSILAEHDILFARSKSRKEQALIHKCEKLMVELDKLARSVAEFEDYSELDCIQEYVADLRGLQKRIQEADETVAQINKEEALLRWKPSDYPLLSNLKTEIEPYQKLFLLILRWQRTEKRWMDEVCSEQDVESMEAEVEEFYSEMDKALRLFQQKQKKDKGCAITFDGSDNKLNCARLL